MAVVAGCWGWGQRIRRRHFLHLWSLRLDDWHLECVVCQAVKDERDRHMSTVPSSNELDIIDPKENPLMVLVQRVWKAIAAGVSSGVAAYIVADQAGSVETGQLIAVILAAIGVALTTYLAPPNQTA